MKRRNLLMVLLSLTGPVSAQQKGKRRKPSVVPLSKPTVTAVAAPVWPVSTTWGITFAPEIETFIIEADGRRVELTPKQVMDILEGK